MEKIDYLLFKDIDPAAVRAVSPTVSILVAADLPRAPLVLGNGTDLRAVVTVWLDSVDERHELQGALGSDADGYLVTESVPQPVVPGALIHFTWFPKPERLTESEFFHGWHEVHTPSTFALHPRRCGYVRDSVARVLTPGSPRVDAIVFEHFPTVEDYTNPKRLFGSKEALDETSRQLSMFADYESISSAPLVRA